jgi:LPXTG-site transpeptidase (sortase) family protein
MDDAATTEAGVSPAPSRSVATRVIRIVGWTSIVAGLLILGFVVQQLFVTTWFAEQHQEALSEEANEYFAEAEITEAEYVPPPPGGTPEDVSGGDSGGSSSSGQVLQGAEPRTILVESAPDRGTAFAVIRIPKIEALVDGWAVVEGVRVGDLKNGAGHMPDTPLPGAPGNAVISGHRTTYGAPFHDVDVLSWGDIIEVDTALGTHTYVVREVKIVKPTDVWVTDPREGAWLTLTTCHPKFSSRQRLIVFAELVDGPNYESIYA